MRKWTARAHAMGQAPSTERRAYKVLLAPGTTHEEHSEIMELVKTKGGSIGFIYWPEPLGFTGTLHEEHLRLLRGRSEVALIIDDDYDGGDGDDLSFTRANTAPAPAPRMEEDDDDSWSSWVCASNRRPPRQQQMQAMDFVPSPPQPPAPQQPEIVSSARYLADGAAASSSSANASSWLPSLSGSGDEEPLTEEEIEKRAVTSVLLQLMPLKTDASTATRFLRAKRGDASAAVSMFKTHLAWRASERIDELWKEPPLSAPQEALLSDIFTPRLLHGNDNEGRPILYLSAHDLPTDSLLAHGLTEDHLIRRYVRIMERILNALDHSSNPLGGHLAIYDVRKMSLLATFRTMHVWIRIGRTLEANYPETLGKLVVVGVPQGAEWIMAKVNGLMNETTAAKIRLHSGVEANEVRRALSEHLPQEVLLRLAGEVDLGSGGAALTQGEAVEEDDEVEVTEAEIIESGRSGIL